MNKFDSPPIVLAHQLAHVVLLPQQPKPSLRREALAYNLANFLRTLATPEPISDWSLTTLRRS